MLMEKDNQNDTQLWLLLKNGNSNALAEIYCNHITSLIAYGSKLCSDEEILKDNIQDLFVELWNSRVNLAQPDCVKFYLFKALRYKLIRAARKIQLQYADADNNPEESSQLLFFEMPIETEIINQETLRSKIILLRRTIDKLSQRQQEVIQLKFYQGFSNDKIAELMHLNYQSVSNLIHSALHRIKSNLKSSSVFTTALLAAMHLFF